MWHTQLPRRELLELCLGGVDPRNVSARKVPGVRVEDYGRNFDAFWTEDPARTGALPTLIVTPDGEEHEFLTAVNASPSAPTPFTAFCRVMTRRVAKSYSQLPLREVPEDALRVLAVVSMVEAVLYSEGRLTLKTVSPAACRRTASFTWARAAATGVPHDSMYELAERWLGVYGLLGQMHESALLASKTYPSLVSIATALIADADDLLGVAVHRVNEGSGFAFEMIRALRSESSIAIERAWQSMASVAGIEISLQDVASQSREDRGAYLQMALRRLGTGAGDVSVVPACAFLATQVAPRSLEHLDILRSSGVPEVALWYACFAALQNPYPMLQLNGWMGQRVLRDIRSVDEHFSVPKADIGYEELNAIARLGMESISRKLGHGGEIEVEIVPNVTASFTFQAKQSGGRTAREPSERQLPLEPQGATFRVSPAVKEQIYRALSQIADAIEDPREPVQLTSPQTPVRKSYRKKG